MIMVMYVFFVLFKACFFKAGSDETSIECKGCFDRVDGKYYWMNCQGKEPRCFLKFDNTDSNRAYVLTDCEVNHCYFRSGNAYVDTGRMFKEGNGHQDPGSWCRGDDYRYTGTRGFVKGKRK